MTRKRYRCRPAIGNDFVHPDARRWLVWDNKGVRGVHCLAHSRRRVDAQRIVNAMNTLSALRESETVRSIKKKRSA